jgi:formamidopyrimidine-DNA glycosylase
LAKGGAKKILYEDYVEEAEQSRYFYGKLHTDKICRYCENVIELEHQQDNSCYICNKWRMLFDVEEDI